MRFVSKLLAFSMALAVHGPSASAQSRRVDLMLRAGAPHGGAIALELSVRGMTVTVVARETDDPGALAREHGAQYVLSVERSGDALVVQAVEVDGGASATWRAPRDVGEPDSRTVALAAATLIEELSRPESEPLRGAVSRPIPGASPAAELSDPVDPPRPFRAPALGIYTALGTGIWWSTGGGTDVRFAAESAVGMQWIEGLRLGLVILMVARHEDSGTSIGVTPHVGLETGGRVGSDDLVFHFGAHALVGLPGGRDVIEPESGGAVSSEYTIAAGGYVGAGLWATRRMEMGMRLDGDAWIDAGIGVSAALRVSLRCEWR